MAEGDCLPTNPVIGVFACLFGEARGGLPRRACQYRVCRFWCLYATGLDGPGHVIRTASFSPFFSLSGFALVHAQVPPPEPTEPPSRLSMFVNDVSNWVDHIITDAKHIITDADHKNTDADHISIDVRGHSLKDQFIGSITAERNPTGSSCA